VQVFNFQGLRKI